MCMREMRYYPLRPASIAQIDLFMLQFNGDT